MKNTTIYLAALCAAFLATNGCSDDSTPAQNAGDTSVQMDASTDVGTDTQMITDGGSDLDETPDHGNDLNDMTGPVQLPTDYQRCTSANDCDIVGATTCVTLLTLNRLDQDGLLEIPLSDVFTELAPGEGVCSAVCNDDPTICDGIVFTDAGGSTVSSTCLVVSTGAAPHQLLAADPFDVIFDKTEVEAGQAFGAICAPPFNLNQDAPSTYCSACETVTDCGSGSTCINLRTEAPKADNESGTGACLPDCATAEDCPMGFACTDTGAGSFCIPSAGTCSDCVDRDDDGFGTGNCGTGNDRITAYDCDDTDAVVYYDAADLFHSFPAECGFFDKNCDGQRDDVQQVGTQTWGADHCTTCGDTCGGPTPGGVFRCLPDLNLAPECVPGCNLGFADCTAAPGCETSETDPAFLYYEDIDEDGFGDPMTKTFFCDAAAAAMAMVKPVQDDTDCDDNNEFSYPGAQEICDGRDNNCDNFDDAAPQASAPIQGVGDLCNVLGQAGQCAISANACTNTTGVWALNCPQTTNPIAELCNGLDDDCDGLDDTVDGDVSDGINSVGDACTVSTTQHDGSTNLCAASTYSCVPGMGEVPLTCAQVVQPVNEESGFDGIDSNCDGHDRYWNSALNRPNAIFVSALAISGNGSPSTPYSGAQLQSAINAAYGCVILAPTALLRCDVYLLASVNYNVPAFTLANGVDIYGGFEPKNAQMQPEIWTDTNARSARPCNNCAAKTVLSIQATPTHILGVRGDNLIKASRLEHLSIKTSDISALSATGGYSNFAMVLKNASGLVMQDMKITSGKAGDGAAGVDGSGGVPLVGTIGGYNYSGTSVPPMTITRQSGTANECGLIARAKGGLSAGGWNIGPNVGGIGQDAPGYTNSGGLGSAPTVLLGANTGWTSLGLGDGLGGKTALNVSPTSNSKWGSLNLSNFVWTPNRGASGRLGQGGGGGGGGGYAFQAISIGSFDVYTTATVSGPAGGCAGQSGSGGYNGGISAALILVDTTMYPKNIELVSGTGGAGGAGGNGGDGSAGGDGQSVPGVYYQTNSIYSRSGHGGHGSGGNGGDNGAGGASISLWRIASNLTSASVTLSNGAGGSGGSGALAGDAGGVGATTDCHQEPSTTPAMTCTRRVAEAGKAGNSLDVDGLSCNDVDQTSATVNSRPTCP